MGVVAAATLMGGLWESQAHELRKVKEDQEITRKQLELIVENNKKYRTLGKVADYIPELGKANNLDIALSIVDGKGNILSVGDVNKRFTIQSISKLVALMVAVQENGEALLFEKMGYYGTDRPFNHYANLETQQKPLNPMMNAGAIYTTGSISGKGDEAYQKVLSMVRYITKNDDIQMNEAVYQSEKETGHRNRAIFHLLKNYGSIDGDEEKLNNYFKQCSIEVNAEDLAKIGYFFANGCVRFDGDTTYANKDLSRLILSQMLIAGMYDFSGEYARTVGLPSKSGVGGGIVVGVPNGIGIGTYSPALDPQGNSIAGYHMILELAKELGLTIF